MFIFCPCVRLCWVFVYVRMCVTVGLCKCDWMNMKSYLSLFICFIQVPNALMVWGLVLRWVLYNCCIRQTPGPSLRSTLGMKGRTRSPWALCSSSMASQHYGLWCRYSLRLGHFGIWTLRGWALGALICPSLVDAAILCLLSLCPSNLDLGYLGLALTLYWFWALLGESRATHTAQSFGWMCTEQQANGAGHARVSAGGGGV